MIRVLKNYKREYLPLNFRGRDITFPPKYSKEFDTSDEEQFAEYRAWQVKWGNESGNNPFIGDVTSKFYPEQKVMDAIPINPIDRDIKEENPTSSLDNLTLHDIEILERKMDLILNQEKEIKEEIEVIRIVIGNILHDISKITINL